MKTELARVQETIGEQSKSAAERIAEMEKQRDAAISEAVYAKTRLAGHAGSPTPDGSSAEGKRSPDQERYSSRRTKPWHHTAHWTANRRKLQRSVFDPHQWYLRRLTCKV